jgi:hypothetical protein
MTIIIRTGASMEEQFKNIEDHIVILGWSPRVPRIIRELRDEVHQGSNDIRPILVVMEQYGEAVECRYEQVYFIYGRLNDAGVLARANLAKARMIMIPTALQNAQSADGQAVFNLMAVLSINPKVRVCVELAKAENADALGHIRENNLNNRDIEIVSFEAVAEKLLAQAAINEGVTRVYQHLLGFSATTNELYITEPAANWRGQSFRTLAYECFEAGVLLIGYERAGELVINPRNREELLQPGDHVWCIAYSKAEALKVINPALLSG